MALIVVFSFGFPAQALTSNDNADRIVRDNASENRMMEEYAPGQVIIKLNEGVSLDDVMDKHQLKLAEKVLKADSKKNKKAEKAMKLRGLDRLHFMEVSSEENLMDVLEELNNDPRVIYAEPNYARNIDVMSNDPDFSKLYGLHNTGQTGGTVDADIDAPEAWDIQTGSNDVVIAVIDTGVDYNHPDLADNMWVNEAELNGILGVDDDNNTFVDDIYGYDFHNKDGDPMDDHNHGTHCAGTIAAAENGIGVVGVNHNVSIMPVKAFSSGGYAYTSDCILAIEYAILMNADIMSNSWGGGGYSQALYDVIAVADDAGILFVAAAGNSGSNNDANPHYPSSYNVSNIIAAAATDHNDNKAYFSCYGPESVDLGAPGVFIYSTLKNGGYGTYSGTSMATPHVAGAAGLIKAQYPDLDSDEIKARLLGGVDVIPSMDGITVSNGRLNAYNSLEDDSVSPAVITNLVITSVAYTSIDLTWTAVGDDYLDGVSSSYDVRYLTTEEITDINWDDASQVAGEPVPGISGSVENFTVENLKFDTTYYFAIKVVDNVGNVAGLSNIASGSTITPVIAFSDNMESSESGWTSNGLWHHETYKSNSPVSSYAYNTGYPYYTYNTGSSNFGSLTSPMIDLSDLDSATLSFEYFYQTEYTGSYWDQRQVQIGVDGVFANLAQLSGDPMLQWNTHIVDMSSYAGQDNIQIRFFFDTKDGILNNFEGWYIDDVLVYDQSSEGNLPPIAMGQDQIVSDGDNNGVETVTLNGSESFDPDGEIALFVWYEEGVALGNGVLLDYEFPIGTYDLILVVQDDNEVTATDEVVITVNPNQLPTANAESNQKSFFVGEQVVFNGSESFDLDGNIVFFEWDFGDDTGASGAIVNYSYSVDGNYTVTLTVTDNGGEIATDTVVVEVVSDTVTATQVQHDNKKQEIKVQATSSEGGAAILEVFNTSSNMSYGQMAYNVEGDFFRLTAEGVITNPGNITIVSSLGGEDTEEVTNKFKENQSNKNK